MVSAVEVDLSLFESAASPHRRLTEIFGMSAELHNASLESWKGTYQWWKQHHNPETGKLPSEWNQSLHDRMRMFTDVRGDDPNGHACLLK